MDTGKIERMVLLVDEASYLANKIKKEVRQLSEEQKNLLQSIIDQHCAVITDRYKNETTSLQKTFIEECRMAKDTLSQYPVYGTAPHEQVFLESYDQAILHYRGEMLQLRDICDILGLKTNPHLHRVLGYNAQEHKPELQDE